MKKPGKLTTFPSSPCPNLLCSWNPTSSRTRNEATLAQQ